MGGARNHTSGMVVRWVELGTILVGPLLVKQTLLVQGPAVAGYHNKEWYDNIITTTRMSFLCSIY